MQSLRPSLIPKIHAGVGRISLMFCGSDVVFSELSSTYPLKLLSPRITRHVAVVYFLSYGGGLVGGDQINISANIDTNTVLVLLSQGSTKVFKARPGQRLASVRIAQPTPLIPVAGTPSPDTPLVTTQSMTCTIAAKSALFLLPDPVTCFRSASYSQTQTFHLSGDASLMVLDWLTSGRISMGEEWAFSRYYSANEVWVNGKRVAKDIMLLDEIDSDAKHFSRSLSSRLAPYACYAMVILCGPLVQGVIQHLSSLHDQISLFKTKSPAEIVWSLSPMTMGGGAIVRVAGRETEIVKRWLGQVLGDIEEIIGTEVYRRAFL